MEAINTLLFYVVAFGALMILAKGSTSAFLTLTGKEAEKFWNRMWPATLMLVGSSFGAGVIIWIGGYLFSA